MTDETKHAIKKSAKDWANSYDNDEDNWDIAHESYYKGATDYYRDGVKEGRRQAVEEAMRLIANLGPVIHRYSAEGLSKELEKLKEK